MCQSLCLVEILDAVERYVSTCHKEFCGEVRIFHAGCKRDSRNLLGLGRGAFDGICHLVGVSGVFSCRRVVLETTKIYYLFVLQRMGDSKLDAGARCNCCHVKTGIKTGDVMRPLI